MSVWMTKLIEKYSEVNEKKKLDPVGQADADIDNDGDVDKSDDYLHNRRKAIGKAIKGKKDDVEMNPKKKNDKADSNMDESVLPPVYARIIENRARHMKGATAPEGIMDKESPKSKEFAAQHKGEVKDPEPTAVADLNKAARIPKGAAKRPGDKADGDKSIINAPEDITKSGAK